MLNTIINKTTIEERILIEVLTILIASQISIIIIQYDKFFFNLELNLFHLFTNNCG